MLKGKIKAVTSCLPAIYSKAELTWTRLWGADYAIEQPVLLSEYPRQRIRLVLKHQRLDDVCWRWKIVICLLFRFLRKKNPPQPSSTIDGLNHMLGCNDHAHITDQRKIKHEQGVAHWSYWCLQFAVLFARFYSPSSKISQGFQVQAQIPQEYLMGQPIRTVCNHVAQSVYCTRVLLKSLCLKPTIKKFSLHVSCRALSALTKETRVECFAWKRLLFDMSDQMYSLHGFVCSSVTWEDYNAVSPYFVGSTEKLTDPMIVVCLVDGWSDKLLDKTGRLCGMNMAKSFWLFGLPFSDGSSTLSVRVYAILALVLLPNPSEISDK